MNIFRTTLFFLFLSTFIFSQDHLLITEIVVTPTSGEFVEIHNPTANPLDLSNYYLTDATSAGNGAFYYNIVTGGNAGGGGFDFHARFPNGATIAPGEFQTIALKAADFAATYGQNPTYEMVETDAAVANLGEAFSGAISESATLSNAGEVIILYFWNGQSDLVQDVDYVVWGDKAEAVDKTGVSIDGPDADSAPSSYLADTDIGAQIPVADGTPHAVGESIQRPVLAENGETLSGGNGITGHDETSENLAASFSAGAPNPGSGPGGSTVPIISNLSRSPASPTPADAVTISATITDDGSIVSAQLLYSTDGLNFTPINMSNTGGDDYEGVIPAQPGGTTVSYQVSAEDNDGNVTQTATLSYVIPGSITPIADIQANPAAFTTVLVEGVVTLGAGRTIDTRTDAYIQDESGRGINIFSFDPPDPLLVRGNRVQITGSVTEFQGVTEITDYSIQLISTGNPIPNPLATSTSGANDLSLEGTYLQTVGVIQTIETDASGANITIDDGSGALLVRVWNTTGIDISGFFAGQQLTVKAVQDIFNSAAQLIPGYADEMTVGNGNIPPVISNFNFTPVTPTPDDAVTVTADVNDDGTVASVMLHVSIDSAPFDSSAMTLSGGNSYEAQIAAHPAGTNVAFFIRAKDDQAATSETLTKSYLVTSVNPGDPHLLISEIAVQPTDGEFVEIYNPTANPVDLSNYYLTDATNVGSGNFYYNIVTGANAGGGGFGDFHAQFPNGAIIAAGDTLTIAMNGSNFMSTFNVQPDFELFDTDANIPDLREALPGSINSQGGLSNAGEVVILYFWDGQSDLVQDVDYVVWGDKAEAVDKSGVAIDGPDADNTPSTYLDDTPIAAQVPVADNTPHGLSESIQRSSSDETGETNSGGNGITGHDETSENLAATFSAAPPTPAGTPISTNQPPQISNISISPDAPDANEAVTISATVTDDGAVADVKLFYSVDGAANDSVAMSASGDNYSAIIPGQADGAAVTYFIRARDNQGAAAQSSAFSYTVGGNLPPVISNITQTPDFPTPADDVQISADVTDDSSVVSVKLFFAFNDAAFDSSDMSLTGGNTYQAQIAAQPEGTRTVYFIRATDNEGASATSAQRTFIFTDATPGGPHLLITELAVLPTDGEFVEIFNPTDQPIDLSNYYLTDATFAGGNTFYYNIVTGNNAGGGDFGDFHARFPDGAIIAPNETQIVALNGAGFLTTFSGVTPTYELFDTDAGIPDMREALPGSINGQGGLTNAGEMIILYFWDGQSDLVQDADYVVWGDKAEAVDKSGVAIDGPDAGSSPTAYQNDTPIDQQISVSVDQPHQFGESIQRLVILENDEIQFAGNGITGHNEMSENLAASFQANAPTPGEVTLPGAPVIESVTFSPTEPTAQDAVTITAKALDADGSIVQAILSYSVNGGVAVDVEMTPGSEVFTAQIPAQSNAALVQFSVTVTDNDGKTASSPSDFYVVGAKDGVIPIATIQDNVAFFDGQPVTIEGVVTLGAGVIITSRLDAYIQDESGKGINLFGFDPPDPLQNIDRFNRLRITGVVSEFGGVTEITGFTGTTLLATNQPLPEPLFVRSGIANDLAFEGTYMRVLGEVTDIATGLGGGTNVTLRDEQGTVLVRIWDITEIDISGFSVGDTISVRGVMDAFNNVAQIVPGYQDEIILPGKTARADGSGIVDVPVTVVAPDSTYESFVVNVIGSIDDTVTTVRLDLPALWQLRAVGDPGPPPITTSVFLNGNPVNSSNFEVGSDLFSPPSLIVKNLTLLKSDTLTFDIQFVITPGESLDSYFWVRTAGKNGRLRLTEKPGKVTVGSGGRQLMFDIQTDSKQFGTVTLRGVTTVGVGLLRVTVSSGDSVTTAYIQDESGRGVNLFRFGFDLNIQRGNLVEIRGTVVEFNGVTEIEYTSSTLLAEGQPLPEPLQLSNSQANSTRWDGTLIATEGVILEKFSAGGGTTLEISDGQGATNVRVWDTARLNLDKFNVNDRILVEGVGGLFISNGDSIFQLLTTYQDQIQIDLNYAPSLDNVELRVEPHPFVPDRGESIDITYNAGVVNNQITIRIFDLSGRLVTTLLDETARLVENQLSWNGRDRLNELVPLGAYICHLEVIEPVSGKKKSKVAPIVVGTVLSR